jgi:hypothetical protein
LLLDGSGGTLQIAAGGSSVNLFPLTPDSAKKFASVLAGNNLQVCGRAEGAPWDFGEANYPTSLWLRLKKSTSPPPPSHPDITIRWGLQINWSYGVSCIIPTGNVSESGGQHPLVTLLAKYGKPGQVVAGGAKGAFGSSGGSWSASWGPGGLTVNAAPPAEAGAPATGSSGPVPWALVGTGPNAGYYFPDFNSFYLYVTQTWSGPVYSDPVGLSCQKAWSFTLLTTQY